MQNKDIIDEIVQMEWEMLQKVRGLDGRAACQNDHGTFYIMRFSNYAPWPEALLLSYTQDLKRAVDENRNLVLEKYAYMMSLSDSAYYKANLADFLPRPNPYLAKMIREIVDYLLDCEQKLQEKYPKICTKGRKLNTSEFDVRFASIETYATGELRTYSAKTLRLFLDFVREEKARGGNLAVEIRTIMVQMYGYASLDEAEERM
ncbi:DUF4125 family protein [Lactovum odontotermitis]